MGLRQDITKIFEELDEKETLMLGIMAMERSEITPYAIWKATKNAAKRRRDEIPQRTVYGKVKKLAEARYIVKVREEEYKRGLVRKFYDLTLKGLLAALANEKVLLEGSLLDRFRAKLHIPERHKKAIKPLISIWAYRESRVSKSARRKIDLDSIFQSVMEMLAAWKDAGPGIRSILSRKFELPPLPKFREELGISDEEYKILNRFVVIMLAYRLPERKEFEKRILLYATGLGPTPWLADCIEILPNFAIRVFWTPEAYTAEEIAKKSNFLSWFSIHKNIATLISQGDPKGLDQYLKQRASKLKVSWRPICLEREYDGMCRVKNKKCPYSSPFECEIVRENAKKFEDFLNFVIKSWKHF